MIVSIVVRRVTLREIAGVKRKAVTTKTWSLHLLVSLKELLLRCKQSAVIVVAIHIFVVNVGNRRNQQLQNGQSLGEIHWMTMVKVPRSPVSMKLQW